MRKNTFSGIGLIGAIAIAAASATGAGANFINNPGFENGLDGWTFTSGDPNALFGLSVENFAFTGTKSVFISAANPTFPITLETTLNSSLVSGQQYVLSFWVYNLSLGNDELGVLLIDDLGNGNGLVQSLLSADIVPTELENWGQIVIPFTASVDGDTLSLSGFDNVFSYHLDHFELTAVPAPGGVLLFGLAAMGRRRRRA